MTLRLGFIGLGDMGRPMALRLLRKGFVLTVHDTRAAAMAEFTAAGAHAADSPRAVASQAEVVFACLPSPAVSEAVALGADGVVHGSAVRQYVEMSTSGSAALECIDIGMRARGIAVLDAPVSGGPTGERAGRLTCFVAARRADYEAVEPALLGLADRLFHIGERPGQAQVLKLANNMLNAANLTLAVEMVQMAARAGIDAATTIEVINASTGRSRATEETYKTQILSGRFHTGARLSILQKDVGLAVEQAQALGIEHSAARAVRDLWDQAVAQGWGDQDLSRIHHFIAGEPAPDGRKTA